MSGIFPGPVLLFLAAFAGGAVVLVTLVRALLLSDDFKQSLPRGLEAGGLALLGGFLAQTCIVLILSSANHSDGVAVLAGWGFFLWPGAINTIPWLLGHELPIPADALPWMAAVVGGVVGMMDGLWSTRGWLGLLSFPLDVTWGLAGNTNGCLMHLVNFAWGDHPDIDASGYGSRYDAHIYKSGFRIKNHFAFTQGEVMSDMGSHDTSSRLFKHEYTHVWQNRAFGPWFTLTYLGWMVVFFFPSLIAGAALRGTASLGDVIQFWTYYNNPWEVWAYAQNNPGSRNHASKWVCWPYAAAVLLTVVFLGGVVPLSYLAISGVW
jgi:hypothetical protein